MKEVKKYSLVITWLRTMIQIMWVYQFKKKDYIHKKNLSNINVSKI